MGQTESSVSVLENTESVKEPKSLNSLQFTVNGKTCTVDKNVTTTTRLAGFLRDELGLTGTKTMCWEGGCGACVITLSSIDPVTGKKKVSAVNSCLVPLLQCHGSEITTVESLGDRKQGYHPVQSRLADLNGTQCGYCSPGMVMSMFSLLANNPTTKVTPVQVENAIDGNLCRCTGYRPIMDAFKTFTNDPVPVDIEEISKLRLCKKGNGPCKKEACTGSCPPKESLPGRVVLADGTWERPENLNSLLAILNGLSEGATYKLIAGNTGAGLYRNDGPIQVSIDVSQVAELQYVSKSTPVTVGGSVSITKLMEILEEVGQSNPDYWYAPVLAEHLGKVAGTSIRNMSTIAGNLMLKHAHPEFPSDLVVLFETVGATLMLQDATGKQSFVTVADFLLNDVNKKVIVALYLPPISNDHVIRTFKIMPRTNNALAYINAGFKARIDRQDNFMVLQKPSIVYGGISPSFIHADVTEAYLTGKYLGDENVFQAALQVLSEEIVPVEDEPNPDPVYRKDVALGLFYKFALEVVGTTADSIYQSGATSLKRGLSTGQQTFDPDFSPGALYKPIPKVEARAQTSGEAEFFDDISPQSNELYAAFVLSTVANCTIESIDPSKALAVEGVVAFYDATNVPGPNIVMSAGSKSDLQEDEEVFVSSKVRYSGQPLGLVVARSYGVALSAARLVSVKYTDLQTPVLSIKDALNYPDRVKPLSTRTFSSEQPGDGRTCNPSEQRKVLKAFARTFEGEFETGAQFNFYLETHFTRCVPTEDGMQVFCGTYDMDYTQKAVAKAVEMNANQIEMQIRRLGGSFGGKCGPAARVAIACAKAAWHLNQPVRMKMDLRSNMEFAGGRVPHYAKYKATVDDTGILQNVEMDIYGNAGGFFNECSVDHTAFLARNCYKAVSWTIKSYMVKTDTPVNTYCRGPGPAESVAIMENIMEHIAKELGQDPLELRLKNLNDERRFPSPRAKTVATSMQAILDQLVQSSDFQARRQQVAEFNSQNHWKKRGISILPMLFDLPSGFEGIWFNVLVAIYHTDGSVVVSHGGIESGQGINTKVTQVVARELDIPIDLISVKSTNTLTNPNTYLTGGSLTSEMNSYGASAAAKELAERMRPIKDQLVNPDWKTLIEACHKANIDLTARHYVNPANDNIIGYNVYGATVAEVELDVLTGEKLIRRVDIIEDAGHSLNPLVDIGQVEGGFVMGVGLWTTERMQFDKTTGKKLTAGTQHYKPAANKDIPEDFRVTLLKNSINPDGVLGCKATGEPPLCMGVSVLFALRNAIEAARADTGLPGWFTLNGPATVDVLQRGTLTDYRQFLYHANKDVKTLKN